MKKKKKKGINKKRLISFLCFALIYGLITSPLLLVYGPFEDIKLLYVASAYGTMNHKYFATMFFSDEALRAMIPGLGTDVSQNVEVQIDTDKTYEIDDDTIEVQNIERFGIKGKIMIIHNPNRVAVGYSKYLDSETPTGQTTSEIVKDSGAVAGVNGGGFTNDDGRVDSSNHTGTGGRVDGFIIHEGEVIQNSVGNYWNERRSVAGMTYGGNLIVGYFNSMDELYNLNVKEAIDFGPPLIINGNKQNPVYDGVAPRTAMGQKVTGEIIMLVIDGRTITNPGASLYDHIGTSLGNPVILL